MPEVIFNGPDGRLEGRYHHSRTRKNAPIALLLHPHPQQGGTMNNRVVFEVYQAFVRKGFATLRFNFRGVGRSQGAYDDGNGELSDAAAALDWLQAANPDATQCWVGGFSFGAWICMQLLMRRPEINSFIAVAPPANRYDFSFLAPCPASGLILHGAEDTIVPQDSVAALAKKLAGQKRIAIDYRVIPGANHFFHDKVDALTSHVDGYLDRVTAKQLAAAR
jgi:alpha/beta superfamily hydrolase